MVTIVGVHVFPCFQIETPCYPFDELTEPEAGRYRMKN